MIKWIAAQIWDFSEYWHIPLGRFAPTIFGLMIGRKGHRRDK